jgi:hypothetical protein
MSAKKKNRPVLVKLEQPKPKSSQAYIEILRGFIDAAHDSEMTFLDIHAIIDGEIRAVSISSPIK